MINRLKKVWSGDEVKGDSMLLWVILALLVVMSFQGHVNILNQTSVVNEIQQQMDVSGLNALNDTVDQKRLREEFVLSDLTTQEFDNEYGKKIVKEFKSEFLQKVGNNDNIKNVRFRNIKVEPIFTDDEVLLSEHILLDAIVSVELETFGVYNPNDMEQLIFDVGQDGNTKIQSIRRNENGRVELFLQNQTRIKYY